MRSILDHGGSTQTQFPGERSQTRSRVSRIVGQLWLPTTGCARKQDIRGPGAGDLIKEFERATFGEPIDGIFEKRFSRNSPRMKLYTFGLLLCLACLIFLAASSSAHPSGDPEAAIENMRQIPQWHCLRYRKFDLVRRCRNYRIGRKH